MHEELLRLHLTASGARSSVYRNSSRHPVRVTSVPTSRAAAATAILGSRAHLAAPLGAWCGLYVCPLPQLPQLRGGEMLPAPCMRGLLRMSDCAAGAARAALSAPSFAPLPTKRQNCHLTAIQPREDGRLANLTRFSVHRMFPSSPVADTPAKET